MTPNHICPIANLMPPNCIVHRNRKYAIIVLQYQSHSLLLSNLLSQELGNLNFVAVKPSWILKFSDVLQLFCIQTLTHLFMLCYYSAKKIDWIEFFVPTNIVTIFRMEPWITLVAHQPHFPFTLHQEHYVTVDFVFSIKDFLLYHLGVVHKVHKLPLTKVYHFLRKVLSKVNYANFSVFRRKMLVYE